jgi:hypothetical protein
MVLINRRIMNKDLALKEAENLSSLGWDFVYVLEIDENNYEAWTGEELGCENKKIIEVYLNGEVA